MVPCHHTLQGMVSSIACQEKRKGGHHPFTPISRCRAGWSIPSVLHGVGDTHPCRKCPGSGKSAWNAKPLVAAFAESLAHGNEAAGRMARHAPELDVLMFEK